MVDETTQDARWRGRNEEKDAVRSAVWSALREPGAGVGPLVSRIPNFVGAEKAAERLAQLPFWARARVVKSNPDPPQAPVRLRALRDGKKVYTPVPELTKDFPFIELDPEELTRRGIPFEEVQYSEAFVELGKRVQFEEMVPLDVVVVGCVAVTRSGARTGKGGGFADLELGIFRELGLVTDATPIVTTVHALQVLDDDRLIMQEHDTPLDWIVPPEEVIETRTAYEQPQGVYWNRVAADQLQDIPFLHDLRERLSPSHRSDKRD